MNELLALTATEAVGLLSKGVVTPLELIEVAVDRIEETDHKINGLPILCIERARKCAENLRGANILFGLPIAVKDLNDVAGVRTTYGSRIFADNVAQRSDIMVEILERNGAIVLGKSNTPEFGAGGNTFNDIFGKTRNPWDTGCTSGGSSGGSAAALATGQVWLATGTDFAGSIRTPASFCGVVGLRPSPGRVPRGPTLLPFSNLTVAGPMGRTVGDVALMLDAMVGQHPLDPLSLPKPPTSFRDAVKHPIYPKRVAYSPDLGITPVDLEVAGICETAMNTFRDLGTEVEIACPDFSNAIESFRNLRALNYAAEKSFLLDRHRDMLNPEVIWNIEYGLKLRAIEIALAERNRGDLYKRVVAFFENFDLLISPSAIVPPFDIDIPYPSVVEGVEFDTYFGWMAIHYVITLTSCPAISVPCGFTERGLPVGIQIVGRPRGEAELLGASALFEAGRELMARAPIDPR